MAHKCCINGCKNRYSPGSQIKFHRIPSGVRLFQAERRQLWIDAIQKANGSTTELNQHSRICGAHFISGEPSHDYDMPDYVPSVFTCTKQRPTSKRKRVEWIYRSRKKRRRSANRGTESNISSEQNSPEKTPPTPIDQEEVELQTEEILTETVCRQRTSSLNTVSPQRMSPVVLLKSVLVPAGGFCCDLCHQVFNSISELINHHQLHHILLSSGSTEEAPMTAEASEAEAEETSETPATGVVTKTSETPATGVVTKTSETPAAGEVTETREPPAAGEVTETSETPATGEVTETSETPATGEVTETREPPAVEAPSVITDEPSFPCNMCDRSFNTSQKLKRHKLLHVKDGRKCPKCGALFCRRHNHIIFQPRFVPVKVSEEDSSSEEEEEGEEEKEEVELEDKEEEVEVKEEEMGQEEQEHLDLSATVENNQPNNVESNEAGEKIENSQITPVFQPQRNAPVICVLPLPRIAQIGPKPPSFPLQIKTAVLTSAETPAMPPSFSPTWLNKSTMPVIQPNSLPDVPPKLPPSLELFSPQRLTSSLLEVKRNYDYILNRPKIPQEPVVKKPVKPVCVVPSQKNAPQVKREKIAYDIEIIL